MLNLLMEPDIDPGKAVNPGLVDETFKEDYIRSLCNMRIPTITVRQIHQLPNGTGVEATPMDLNYVSMTFKVIGGAPFLSSFQEQLQVLELQDQCTLPRLQIPKPAISL
ncbi:subtilisin-like protease SBT4.3 [Forsythia ovata]|uniref:Subtilisin-like protease SBT4.3 n=1 Tax=Forsythia ovata TaxID=205694 RepID=A0ABD1X142_9LAMI